MSEIESMLREVWTTLFGSQGNPDGDFFELGGNSLTAIQLISRVQETFECELELSDIFDNPTIPDLAQRIRSVKAGASAAP